MVRYAFEQRVFLYGGYMKYGSAGNCRRNFWHKFSDEIVPSRQRVHNLVNKLRTTRLAINKQQKYKRRVLTEKLDDTGGRLEHTPRKSLKCLAQETGVSKPIARTATQLLKPSSESWYLVCCKSKKDCCTCVFNETINCERYLRVEEQRFQHLLESVNKGKNFHSFQLLSTCWVIGKIRVRFSAGGAPVAVKRRAVNASSLIKTTRYKYYAKNFYKNHLWWVENLTITKENKGLIVRCATCILALKLHEGFLLCWKVPRFFFFIS
jgi:hypothetical protein